MLTLEQQKAVDYNGRYALVRAVAGSGKSHMLVYRIKNLVENHDVDPYGILVLMFNVSAAEMFKERLASLSLDDVANVFTFHSFALQLHDEFKEKYGSIGNYYILSENEELEYFREMVWHWNGQNEYQFNTTRDALYTLYKEMDFLKNFDAPYNLTMPMDIEDFDVKIEFLKAWNHQRRDDSVMGMTDMLYDLVYKCRLKPDFLRHIQNVFSHIVVDEYQDSNALQQWLLTSLCNENTETELMCVGDEDQCIYAFRGSDPNYMAEMFFNAFPEAEEFQLSRTFRYGHNIALLANQIISENTKRSLKWCYSGVGQKMSQVSLIQSDAHGSEIMAAFLRGQLRNATILIRSHHHGDDIELAFWRQGYEITADKPFWTRPAGEFLKLVIALKKDPKAIANDQSLFFLLKWVFPHADRKLTDYGISLLTTGPLLYRLQNAQINLGVDASLRRPLFLMEQIIRGVLNDVTYIHELIGLLMSHTSTKTLPLWMQEMNNWSQDFMWLDKELTVSRVSSDINMTTIHKSKGQGYPFVIIPHVEKGMFPTLKSNKEEERRLFYVGVTRAEEKLWILTSNDVGKFSDFVNEEMFQISEKWGDFFRYQKTMPNFGDNNSYVKMYAKELNVTIAKKSSWGALKK